MRERCPRSRRAVAACLCLGLLLTLLPPAVGATDGPRITIEIGQPAIWSLGQAHYLLSRMHRRNRKLSTPLPNEDALDPNKIAATRIEALRSSLGVEAQFDQEMLVKNRIAMERFREGEVRREQSRGELRARQAELQTLDGELAALEEEIAVLEEENRQSAETRGRAEPPAPPTAADNERSRQLALLRVRKTRKDAQRTALNSQIGTLTTTVNTAPATPDFETPSVSTTPGALPNPDAFKAFMEKAVREAGKPDLSASMKLDNFVQMQYEIVAKQLTLLRDEVGPDDRVVFLELPASIYTVDKKADGYVAQVEWEVVRYFDREPSREVRAGVILENLQKEGKSDEEIARALLKIEDVQHTTLAQKWLDSAVAARGAQLMTERAADLQDQGKVAAARASIAREERELRDELNELRRKPGQPYPVTLEMIKRGGEGGGTAASSEAFSGSASPTKLDVRAIDIIPRQSALNVNEAHATVKQTSILAAFKFLIGFAGSVNYQRQRELYEQFVQQQIFASGFGKGLNKFGWTYGPQPGTKRIAPGQRTTFAVLAVPRNTLAIQLRAKGKFYKRDESPVNNPDDVRETGETDYLLSVPGRRTQEFWVDGISYSPVRKGRRVTAIINGDYFSPQLGVLVNGVPLEPALSITRAAGADEEADVQSADGVAGEYEIVNSRQIALSFTMGDAFVGTPNITFVAPEKSTPINFFNLLLNHRGYDSLQRHSLREPMFIEDFALEEKLELLDSFERAKLKPDGSPELDKDGKEVTETYRLARLKGHGLRPNAEVFINGDRVGDDEAAPTSETLSAIVSRIKSSPRLEEFRLHDSTKSYLILFRDPGGNERQVRYRHLTRQGFDEREFTESLVVPAVRHTLRRYQFNPADRRGEADLTFAATGEGRSIADVAVDDPDGGRCLPPRRDGRSFRVKCLIPAGGGQTERDFFTARVTIIDAAGNTVTKFEDITLPIRSLVTGAVNPRTGQASGPAADDATAVITGVNLQGVARVFFGDRELRVTGSSPESVTVVVPKLPGVPRGQSVTVPVVALRASGDAIPSAAVYTYVGEPQPQSTAQPRAGGRAEGEN